MDVVNIGLAFLEGVALILTPCILPILPIILSSAIQGNKKHPYGVILGFIITFALITFFARQLTYYSGVDLSVIRYVSYALLILIGIIMLSDYLSEKFTQLLQRLTNVSAKTSFQNNGFVDGIFVGALLGIIWTPCAGPILAAVIVQTVLQKTTFTSFLTILAFAIGAGIPMLLIALFGRSIIDTFGIFKRHSELLRKILGAIILASVAYMFYGERAVAALPQAVNDNSHIAILQNRLANPYPAPAISGIDTWINSPPLQLQQLRGKVVLIDFWDYSCINCIRTLPYLRDWYQKYQQQGFVIIGIHSPEFLFEQNVANVKKAVVDYRINYPVALDNKFSTWQNYHNLYWPAHYLIDKNGYVVYQHFGEGEYATTENNIRYLLGMKPRTIANVAENDNFDLTPETYLGYARANHFASPQSLVHNKTTHYRFPEKLPDNAWALQGEWDVYPDKAVTKAANAAIKIRFNAKQVFMVVGATKPVKLNLLLNGEKLIVDHGKDVINGSVIVQQYRLYKLVNLKHGNSGVLEIIATTPGIEMYTFTFGNE